MVMDIESKHANAGNNSVRLLARERATRAGECRGGKEGHYHAALLCSLHE